MESYKKIIGKKIQRRRSELGFENQESLANKLGVDQSQIARWESGRHIPEGQHRKNLGTLLHVDDDFFETIELPAPEALVDITSEEILKRLDSIESKLPSAADMAEYGRLKAFEARIIEFGGQDLLEALQQMNEITAAGFRFAAGLEPLPPKAPRPGEPATETPREYRQAKKPVG